MSKRSRPSDGGEAEDDDDVGSAVDDAAFDVANKLRSTMDNAASEFVCPITQELPIDPVTAMDGKVYERKAIVEWIQRGNGKSPMTNLPMTGQLLPATHVRNSLELMVKSGAITGDKVDAWKKKIEDEGKVEQLRAKAVAGDPAAACKLGLHFIYGRHGLDNPQEGFSWMQKSASAGYNIATGQVGRCYLEGTGVEKHMSLGLVMLTEAAMMGDGLSCWQLGYMFRKGYFGAKKDKKVAAKWFQKLRECERGDLPLKLALRTAALEWLDLYNAELAQQGS